MPRNSRKAGNRCTGCDGDPQKRIKLVNTAKCSLSVNSEGELLGAGGKNRTYFRGPSDPEDLRFKGEQRQGHINGTFFFVLLLNLWSSIASTYLNR